MLKKLSIVISFIFLVINVYAQGIRWAKSYGGSSYESASCIQQTSDGGYIVVGSANSSDGDVSGHHGNTYSYQDWWVIKTDDTGTIIWEKCFGGTGAEKATSVQQTNDGGYIVAGGSFSLDGDVIGNHGGPQDFWILKLDGNGIIQWQKTLGGSGNEYANFIQNTPDGGYIVTGNSSSNDGDVTGHHNGTTNYDIWVVKLNVLGSLQWGKSLGGTENEEVFSIQNTNDGGYIIGGASYSLDGDVSSNDGGWDCWIVKLDNSGSIQWQKSLGGSSWEYIHSIEQTTDGGYIAAGSSSSNDGDVIGNHGANDYWVVKFDSSGILLWQKCFGGSGNDYASTIRQTSDGGYIVSGGTDSNDGDLADDYRGNSLVYNWILKLDLNGGIIWKRVLGGNHMHYESSIQQTLDGDYILSTTSTETNEDVADNHGSGDYLVVKFCTAPIPVISVSPSNVICPDDTVVLTSSPSSNYLWNKGDTIQSVVATSHGYYGVVVSDSTGCRTISNFVQIINKIDTTIESNGWSFSVESYYNGSSYQWLNCDSGYSIIAGDTSPTFYPPSPGKYALMVSYPGCLTDTSSCFNFEPFGLSENSISSSIRIFPNPSLNSFTVYSSEIINEIRITDIIGKEIKKIKSIGKQEVTVERGEMSSGIYFVQITSEKKNIISEKIIIQ